MFTIAICDDERKEAEEIKRMVEVFMIEHALIHKIHIFVSGEDLISSSEHFDFVFLDISMRGMNGIETGMKLYQKSRKIRLVYITNYKEYCNDAVNHAHAFAYLSKPIVKEQFKNQIGELVEAIALDRGSEIEIELFNVTVISEKEEKEYLAVKIPLSNIIYFEYVKANRKIRVKTKKITYEYSGTMAEIERRVGMYGFGTCYRGILVNFMHITKSKRNIVCLNSGEKLPLSQKRTVKFKEQLNDYIHRSS